MKKTLLLILILKSVVIGLFKYFIKFTKTIKVEQQPCVCCEISAGL